MGDGQAVCRHQNKVGAEKVVDVSHGEARGSGHAGAALSV